MKILKGEKRKKNFFFKFWKLGAVYFCKHFSTFSKLGAGSGGQPNNFFFRPHPYHFIQTY